VSPRLPTPEQRAAIEGGARTVMVEAGAGTGKTGVMVDRYCRLACDESVAPEAILAFTFTDKAAAELRERIRSEIARRAGAGSERARQLLPGLGGAWVTTIHGFCNRLLAGHPVTVGIDPRFRVLDSPEAERAAREAFEQALERFLADEAAVRERTLAAFDLPGLRATAIAAHAELRSRGDAEPRLPDPPPADLVGALGRARDAVEQALAELAADDERRALLERAGAVLADGGRPGLDELCSLCTSTRAKPLAAYREAIEEAARRCAEAGEGGVAYRHLAVLLRLFGERYAAAKERRAGLDFEDLQLLTAQLLERSELGADYRDRFSHLLVDEFQDTNRLQLRLIEALRGPETRLMVVGDELQSIYGFRHADLDVFREQREAIAARADGEVLALSGNFRSSPEVIGAVNAIGEALLPDRYRPLRVGSPPEPGRAAGGVELLLTAARGWDGDGVELDPATDARSPREVLAEARFVAERLRQLAEQGEGRGDMVVLLRAFTHLDAYEDSLARAGLRPYVVGGRGYWSQQQVADACALLAVLANPLDDQALFGALASSACAVTPDTLWLLRAAAGGGRHVWPAVERLAELGEGEIAAPEELDSIADSERALLVRFSERIAGLRARAPLLPLAELIDAVVSETGYDLAVLMRPAGEARFANVRKLMRLAADFEASEGRDLRGLLDFLSARAEADADAQAATAVEGHDGVRIMTVHSAKGLEFDVVAVPQLARRLLITRPPALTIGHEPESPRVGLQLPRLGAGSLKLFSHRELCEEQQRREAEEELRLFHVAATRARRRLILSGVVKEEASRNGSAGTPVIERIVAAFDVDRERDSTISIPAPGPRPGLELELPPSELPVRVNLPSPERAAELRRRDGSRSTATDPGEGPAPLLQRRPPPASRRPLSYTALTAEDDAGVRPLSRMAGQTAKGPGTGGDGVAEPDREAAVAEGIAVHSLLEWSQANDWREPPPETVRRFALAAGLDDGAPEGVERLLAPLRALRESSFFSDRIAPARRCRAELPILLDLDGNVMRGSIDLLVENDGEPPLIVDYKTDRLDGADPAAHAERYAVQRAIYALAVTRATGAEEVEVAYVFLERPGEPVVALLSAADIEWGRGMIATRIASLAA
jgi:ATP-dependent helicase/nuclease subunit A